jgi:hypothetical protein
LLVLPFILAYILIPWRLNLLFKIAVSQYERVPTRKVKGNITREIKEKRMPKRLLVIIILSYIILDYLTLVEIIILLTTLWRTVNTCSIINMFWRWRITND